LSRDDYLTISLLFFYKAFLTFRVLTKEEVMNQYVCGIDTGHYTRPVRNNRLGESLGETTIVIIPDFFRGE
jgi:hypothetical protein